MTRKRLLIAEDDPAVSRVLEHSFSRAGYDVLIARDGERALELLLANRVDGMITDMQMPRLGGRELCERLRHEDAGLLPSFIFVVTSRSGPEERSWIGGFSRAELVEKPVSPRELLRLVADKFESLEGARKPEDEERAA